jgi:serine/threonine-protein kinase
VSDATVNCLRESAITAFVNGSLDEEGLRAVERHLDDCAACRTVIADAAYGALGRTGSQSTTSSGPDDPTTAEVARQTGSPMGLGDVIAGKYEVEHLLGSGGMGEVFAARHLELGQRVAIKVLHHRGPTATQRFLREARTSANLGSDHVPRVFDVGRLPGGAPYIVMEYLVGQDLRRLLAQGGPVAPVQAVSYVLDACAALVEAHAAGIVHRDLKPANLFLEATAGGRLLVKVLDFGVSKITSDEGGDSDEEQGLTSTGVVLGSPLYMSPEQVRARKDVDARTDIWSLGVILYELLSGRPPFRAPTLPALAVAIAVETPPPLSSLRPDLPPGLEALIERCLEKSPDARFASVEELARALRPFATATTPSGAVASAPARRRPSSSRRVGVILGAGAALALAGVIGLRAFRPAAAEKPAVAGVMRPVPVVAAHSQSLAEPAQPPARPPAPPSPAVERRALAAPSRPASTSARRPGASTVSGPAVRRSLQAPGPLDTPD